MPNDMLWTAYEHAVLRLGRAGQITIDLTRPLAASTVAALSALGIGNQFAIVTAWNPGGRIVSPVRNRWRGACLCLVLVLHGAPFVAAVGESPDGSHHEQGFAVGTGRQHATTLARRFGQLAIYWFDGESIWLDSVQSARAPVRLPVECV